jgi:hypothetical protein
MFSTHCKTRYFLAAISLTILAVSLIPFGGKAYSSSAPQQSYAKDVVQQYPPLHAIDGAGIFLIKASGGNAMCIPASPEEAQQYTVSQDFGLHQINHLGGIRPEATGLQITLQATQQLEGFPQAKAAFIKAAANWEAVIQTPLTIIVNVDYGPTRFGQGAYPPDVLGSTSAQMVGSSGDYTNVASSLLSGASTAQEVLLYNNLPASSVPTDLGSTSQVAASTATFRALGMLSATANPPAESQLGSPPSIGFNSVFQFDFDPTNGIDAGSYDFQAVATHELGHVLGFDSTVGNTQLNPSGGLAVTVWDLFRFRPGTTPDSFQTAQRIQSTGGTQVYYFGGPELGLSTGGPDGKNGDGFQASHWKAVDLTGVLIGIMDPTVPKGQARTISNNDLAAIDSMGFTLVPGAGGSGGGVKLTSGASQGGAVAPAQPNQCGLGTTQYTILVPQGASGLTVTLNGNQQDDLLVRYGQQVTITGGVAQADFQAHASGTSQTVTVTPTGSPALQTGTYYVAVANCATSTMNYTVKATVSGGTSGDSTPTITNLTASLAGNTLTLKGTAADPGGDLIKANAVFLDGTGHAVGTTSPFQYNFGSLASSLFTITVGNMQNFPQAVSVTLTVIDSSANVSAPVTAGFGDADSGGPSVTSVSFDGRNDLMIIKGGGFTGQLQLEINGVIVAPPLKIKAKGGGAKLKIVGSGPDLNLKNGPNRLRMLNDGLHSNIVVLTL